MYLIRIRIILLELIAFSRVELIAVKAHTVQENDAPQAQTKTPHRHHGAAGF
jgi:hypothetical protein